MANKTVTVLLKAITGAYRAEMVKSAAATQALAGSAGKAGAAQRFLQNTLGPTGMAAAKVAAGFGLVGGVGAALLGSAKAAIQFESDFAGVRKTVDATPRQLDAIAIGFRNMSTEIPVTTATLTAVGEAAGQLGIEKENILSFTKVMVDLGNTTNLSAEEAANALARLANITQMPEDQFDELGSSLVHLGNKFAATESEIAEMSLRIAGAGNIIGLTEPEILGFATALTDVGVKAEAGGSAISRVFLTLQSAVQAGGADLKEFSDISGTTAKNFKEQFDKAPAQAVESFIAGLGKMHEAGTLTNDTFVALGLSEIRVRDALLRLAGAGDLTARALAVGNQGWQENTALIREAEKRYETTASRIEIAKNSIKDLGIEIGNNLLPVLGHVADSISALMGGIMGKAAPPDSPMSINFWNALGGAIKFVVPVLKDVGKEHEAAARQQALMEAGIGNYVQTLTLFDEASQSAAVAQSQLSSETERGTTAAGRAAANMGLVKGTTEETAAQTRDAASAFAEMGKRTEYAAHSTELLALQAVDAARFAGKYTEATEQAQIETQLYGETADEAAAQLVELTENQKKLQEAIRGFFEPLDAYNTALEKNETAMRENAETAADASKSSSDSWEDFQKSVSVSGKELIKELRNQVKAHEEWEANLKKIAKRGRADIATELAAMGPEAAGLVATMANMTEKEFKTAARLWTKNTKQGSDDSTTALERGLGRMATVGSRGTEGVTGGISDQLRKGARGAAKIVDGYAGSLKAGLNPVIISVGGSKITLSATAAQAWIQNKLAAHGGIHERDRSSAHMVSGMSVIYGEPETSGEAFIPLSPAKRPRSRLIAAETVRRLGGDVQWMAEGGFTSIKDVPQVPNIGNHDFGRTGERSMSHTRAAVIKWLKKNLMGAIGPAADWARAQAGKPYVWGGVGPGGYDCSGFISALTNVIKRRLPPYRRLFTTSSMIDSGGMGGYVPGNSGQMRIGVFKGSPGHMAGTLQNMNVESRGSAGVVIGSNARGADDPLFSHHYRLAALGGFLAASSSIARGDAPFDLMNQDPRKVPFMRFDHGGFLPRGLSMAYNGTGAPERVEPSPFGGQIMVIVPGLGETFMGEVRKLSATQARLASHRGRAMT